MTIQGNIYSLMWKEQIRYGIAVSNVDVEGDVQIVLLQEGISPSDAKPEQFLTGKPLVLPEENLVEVQSEFDLILVEKVLREVVKDSAVRHYHIKHGRKKTFEPGQSIGYGGRYFDEREVVNLIDSSLDFWLTTGRYTEQFERNLAKYLGLRYCLVTNSGSSANLLAFMALTSPMLKERRIRKGDEVITVAASFPTTVNPIIQFGAVPVFVDIELETYNMDTSKLRDALSDRTKAVMIAHTLGNPYHLQQIRDFCDEHGLWLIEDNCDALGSRFYYNGEWKYTGTVGHIGTSSFYPPHHITMGEGGAVYTNDPILKRAVESFRDWGRDCWCASGCDNTCKRRFAQQFGELPEGYDHKYVYSHFGYNLKITDMQAAIGCAQLEKLPYITEARKKNWQRLYDRVSHLSEYFYLPRATEYSDPSWFGFLLTIKENAPFTREQLVQHLESKGVQTRMLFAGNLIRQPLFDEMRATGEGYRVVGDLTNTDIVMQRTLWLGVYPGLDDEKIDYMAQQVINFVTPR
ncbi:MAG: lipopolysaccharide biosynthesis protein RfbH [Candidatus Cohnella colombiensis]|uniref:Lipopolysaccharide biosynthesis protein RfbH n=1 Tax=Candidatus Cohnella colombiensis TaxID=3121368 RepID=A0AA95EVU9_9BACL|nr:MAG: lipopolysaccharide biosynthesis protein RfbH [Cohnella sp.]